MRLYLPPCDGKFHVGVFLPIQWEQPFRLREKINGIQFIVGGSILLNLPLAYLFLFLGICTSSRLGYLNMFSVITLFQRLSDFTPLYRFSLFSFLLQRFFQIGGNCIY